MEVQEAVAQEAQGGVAQGVHLEELEVSLYSKEPQSDLVPCIWSHYQLASLSLLTVQQSLRTLTTLELY